MKRVYRIYAPDGELLYVGKSANVNNRLAMHKRWMTDGCRVDRTEPLNDLEATIVERRAIICERPKRNVQWKQHCAFTLADASLAAPHAALYLVGQQPRYEGWAEQIVEGYGVEVIPYITKGYWRGWRRYRLVDLEQIYRELHTAEAAA